MFSCPDSAVADQAAAPRHAGVPDPDDRRHPGRRGFRSHEERVAIALGVSDGLGDLSDEPWHNLKAATFAQAVAELQRVTAAVGGQAGTAIGLAGVGGLEVTGLSGRSKVYGARIGKGEPAKAALEAMVAANQAVEVWPLPVSAAELAGQLDLADLPPAPRDHRVLDGGDSRPSALLKPLPANQ